MNKLQRMTYCTAFSLLGVLSSSIQIADSIPKNMQEYNHDDNDANYINNNDGVVMKTKQTQTIEDLLNNQETINFEEAYTEFNTKKIPVVMFHNIHENENRYTISPQNFRKLLDDLHQNDFYSVTLEEYAKGNFSNVPIGKKPLLITFDDASTGQFMLTNNGEICTKSAIGIMEDFYKEKDFGRGGVFFVSFGERNDFRLPFMQNELAPQKMQMLLNMGYDVAYHTIFHPNNANATKNNIYEQKTMADALFKYLLGDKFDDIRIKAFAHPFGSTPQNTSVEDSLHKSYDLTFLAWGGASTHPLAKNYDPNKITRIEMTYQTRNLITNARNLYRVTPETKKYYEYIKEFENNNSDYYVLKYAENNHSGQSSLLRKVFK